MIRRAILILLILLAVSSIGSAANITVGYSGNTGTYTTDGTDDHVEIQQALDAANATGGGTVYLKGPNKVGPTNNDAWIGDQLQVMIS